MSDIVNNRPDDEIDRYYPTFNNNKVCQIKTEGLGSLYVIDSNWNNWRSEDVNPAKIHVDERIHLFVDEKNFNFSYSNNIGKAWEKFENGFLGKVQGALEAARNIALLSGGDNGMDQLVGGKFLSRYKEAPQWDGTDPIKLPDVKFSFQWGQARIFDSLEEVVKPVLALASLWVPIPGDGEDKNYYKGIVPTAPYYLGHLLKARGKDKNIGGQDIASEGDGNIIEADMGRSVDKNLLQKLTDVEKAMIKIQETAIKSALNESASRALCVKIGSLIFGPMIVKEVNWSFDFTHVDAKGNPYKGQVTFGGLESIIMPTPGQIKNFMASIGDAKRASNAEEGA